MKQMRITPILLLLVLVGVLMCLLPYQVMAIEALYNTDARDSRIKTYLYSENEIYRLLLYQGFQSSIEFAEGEVINTVSLGDNYAWKITPLDRRLFIKPLSEGMHTNMTVITNRRTYQFEILAKTPSDHVEKDFVYVMRFFYPSDNRRGLDNGR